jgi:hypothetical protein
MPKYIVTVKEVWNQDVIIEALDADDARERVEAGEGEQIPESNEYDYTLESDCWPIRNFSQ